MNSIKLQPNQGYQYLLEEKYIEASSFYEEAITANPNVITNYWYLGLIHLLQGDEEEAQVTWLLAMAEVDETPKISSTSSYFARAVSYCSKLSKKGIRRATINGCTA